MSRDYRTVVNTPKGLRFKKPGPTFNANVWCVEYYGRIFKHLGLPLEKSLGFPRIAHEYKDEDLEAVRKIAGVTGFSGELLEAIQKVNFEMDYDPLTHGYASVGQLADEMLNDVFPVFLDPEAVAVASDYCEEYDKEG